MMTVQITAGSLEPEPRRKIAPPRTLRTLWLSSSLKSCQRAFNIRNWIRNNIDPAPRRFDNGRPIISTRHRRRQLPPAISVSSRSVVAPAPKFVGRIIRGSSTRSEKWAGFERNEVDPAKCVAGNRARAHHNGIVAVFKSYATWLARTTAEGEGPLQFWASDRMRDDRGGTYLRWKDVSTRHGPHRAWGNAILQVNWWELQYAIRWP
jgi:hypothetical protein